MRCSTPGKDRSAAGDRVVRDADRAGRGGRGGGILSVVRPGDQRLGGERVVSCEHDPPGGARDRAEPAWYDGHVVVGLMCEHAQLRGRVRVERAMPVDVVGLQVEQHRDARSQCLHVLELERRQLADDPGVGLDGADERGERMTDVARHRSRPARCVEDRAEQRGRRRLSVRSGDADQRVGQQPGAELDLRDDADAARLARRLPVARHRGRRGS